MEQVENAPDTLEGLASLRSREEARSARYFSALRVALTVCTALSFAVFGRLQCVARLQNAGALFAAYGLAAFGLYRASCHSARWAHATGLALPLLDVPLTAALVFVLYETPQGAPALI